MKLPSLFRTPSHQRFVYKTRYWNENKEALENQIRAAEARRDGDLEAIKANVSKTFKRGGGGRNYMVERTYRAQQTRRSNIRLVIIIGILLVATYLLLR